MAVRVTADEFQEKHNRRTKAALEDMRKGVERVTEAPGVKAAKAQDKMRAKLVESIDSGKWGKRVAAVSLDDWKKDMVEKGVGRVSAGLDRSADKVRSFAEQLIAHENKLLGTIERMPDLTLEDSIARATSWIRGMSEFEKE